MSSPALLSLLGRVNGLDSVQHQILQLQRFHQVCVPNDACVRGEQTYCLSCIYCDIMFWHKEEERTVNRHWVCCSTSVKGLEVIQSLINGVHLITSLLQNGAGTEHCSMGLHGL